MADSKNQESINNGKIENDEHEVARSMSESSSLSSSLPSSSVSVAAETTTEVESTTATGSIAERLGEILVEESDGEFDEHDVARSMSESSSSSSAAVEVAAESTTATGSIAERLSEILVEESDGDLLIQQSDRDNNYLQWLQALDLQHIGACRVDERLKPLLKLNNSSSISNSSQDYLLSHLSQHFEASEVGLLARCLCVPLVSIRVGKVEKQGSMLCPTSTRGNLNLTLLPSSDLRISFVGDNGQTERLATLNDSSECSAVVVEEIPADESGRSFLMELPDGRTLYFWCSEKSKLLGNDLLLKMKDLLKRKPTLAELTGISESRLECFASRLRSCFVGPSVNNIPPSSSTLWTDLRFEAIEGGENTQSSSSLTRPLRSRQSTGQTMKGHTPFQVSLSPRPSSFKEGLPRSLASLRSTSRDKVRRRGDLHLPVVGSSFMADSVLNFSEKGKSSEVLSTNSASPLSFLESLGSCSVPTSPDATAQFPPIGALLSPYYCWCPPCTSPSVSSISKLPTPIAEPFSLPPLSTLLPATETPSMLPQIPPLDLASVPSLEFPALLADPLTRLSFAKQSTQFSTFTPLMCDPIVHIPVVDFCSSGQGYLVSAGPGMATSIPPLHPKLIGTMIPESESMVDKGARETLRLLIGGSSGPSSSLMGVFPAVLNEDAQGVVVAGSRGLYSGMSDVNSIVNSFAAVRLSSVSERSTRGINLKNCYDTGAADVFENTANNVDLQDSAFTSRDEEKD